MDERSEQFSFFSSLKAMFASSNILTACADTSKAIKEDDDLLFFYQHRRANRYITIKVFHITIFK